MSQTTKKNRDRCILGYCSTIKSLRMLASMVGQIRSMKFCNCINFQIRDLKMYAWKTWALENMFESSRFQRIIRLKKRLWNVLLKIVNNVAYLFVFCLIALFHFYPRSWFSAGVRGWEIIKQIANTSGDAKFSAPTFNLLSQGFQFTVPDFQFYCHRTSIYSRQIWIYYHQDFSLPSPTCNLLSRVFNFSSPFPELEDTFSDSFFSFFV